MVPRGRTRDEAARTRILDATFELVGSGQPGQVTVDQIATHAQVAKQTIYRWWPSRTAVVLDALVEASLQATPFPESSDVRNDFERHLRSVITLFNSPTGRIIRELVADSQSDPTIADEFRDRFWAPRRELSRARLAAAAQQGVLRPDLDIELVLDTIYGPLWLRLLVGHQPLQPRHATRVLDAVWSGIAARM